MSTTSLRPPAESASHQFARERFGRKSLADKYPSEYSNRWRDRREKACIVSCLRAIPAGSHVLDLPCGTGRLTRMLVEARLSRHQCRCFRGDARRGPATSIKRIARNKAERRRTCSSACATCSRPASRTMSSTASRASACFTTFNEAETRRQALRELARICHGPIVVTFLNSFALDRFSSWFKARIRGRKQLSQLPIPSPRLPPISKRPVCKLIGRSPPIGEFRRVGSWC